MGMFDNLRCEYPLPDAAAQNFDFQTQSLDCLLDDYVITKEGRLVKHYVDWEATPEEERIVPEDLTGSVWEGLWGRTRVEAGSERDIDTNFHGWLNFCGNRTREIRAINLKTGEDELHPGPPPEWFEYNAKFTGGTLVEITRVRKGQGGESQLKRCGSEV